jgi:hypothetical protein
VRRQRRSRIGGAGRLTATQTSLIATAATGAFNVKTLAEEAVQNVAGAVEVASEAAGGTQPTLTGTLTESGPGTGQFTWAAGPNDKMIVTQRRPHVHHHDRRLHRLPGRHR